jgi:predicted RND superfamily exporter protein
MAERIDVREDRGIAARYARFMLRWRKPLFMFVVISTVLAATQIPKVDMRNDPDTLLPPTNRYVATNAYGEQKFGMGNLMVFGLEVLEGDDIYQAWFINLIQELHQKLESLPNARRKNFLDIAAQKVKFMGATEGGLAFKRMMPTGGISTDDPALGRQQLDFLKQAVETNPVLAPMLIYKEGADGHKCTFGDPDWEQCTAKAVFLIADYDDGVKEIYLPWVRQVRQIVADIEDDPRYQGKVKVLVAGEPYFLAYMLLDLAKKWWLFAISLLIVVVVLWTQNRSWRGALFALFGVSVTITWTLGLMGFTQFKLTTMMVLTPMLLLAIGTGHAVQVTRRFLLEMAHRHDANLAALVAIRYTIVPATVSIITDAAGFATLALVDISFYKAYAWFGRFGMASLLLTTTTLIPLMMVLFAPKEQGVVARGVAPWEQRISDWVVALLTGPGKWVPIGVVVVVIGVSAYYTDVIHGTAEDPMPGVERGINYARAAFKEDSITIEHIDRLGEIMPGVISANIPFRGKARMRPECVDMTDEGDLLPPGCWDPETEPEQGIFNNAEAMAAIEKFEDWMRMHPYIGFTGSYVQYLKIANMLLAKKPAAKPEMRLFQVPNASFIRANPEEYRDPRDSEFDPATSENADLIVANYNGLLQTNSSPGDLDSFVDYISWNEGIIMAFVNTMHPVRTHQLVVDIQDYLRAHKDEPGFRDIDFGFKNGDQVVMPETGKRVEISGDPAITDPGIGGFLGATEATREVAMAEWLKTPLTTATAIFIITALVLRSLSASVILMAMLVVPLIAQYGLGGYLSSVENWSGNLAFHTLVALSVALGLGVDYGIYMIARLREEMRAMDQDWWAALRHTLSTTGSAIVVSVLVLLGSFIPLLNTQLANTWVLGIYIGMALIIDVFAALTLLPLLVYWLKPRFVFGKTPAPRPAT